MQIICLQENIGKRPYAIFLRMTEKEVPELGERVFYDSDFLITYFEGSAYSINCKDIEKAEELAHSLKSSMIR